MQGRRRTRMGQRRGIVTIAALALFATVCTGGGDAEPPPPDDGGVAVSNPGVFVHVQNGEPASMDPARAEQGEKGEEIISNVYERLLAIAPGSPELEPALAEEVPSEEAGLVSADGLEYTFPIREGVVFQDGSELTCEDVEFSWDRLITMNLPEGQAYLVTDTVEDFGCDGDDFRVLLRAPDASFLNSVVVSPALSVMSQEAVEANGGVVPDEPNEYFDQNAMGTGPYELAEWARGEFIDLQVFEGYWGEPASLDVRWEVTEDEGARILQLQAGDADTIDISPSNISEVEGIEGVAIESGQLTLEPIHLSFNFAFRQEDLPGSDTVPEDFFHDVRVRQAFSYAFDYDTYINEFLDGFAARYTSYVPQGVLGYDPSAPIYGYDPAQAEELFRQTPWWDEGFTVSILVQSGEPEFEGVALLMKDGLEALNPRFRVQVVARPEAQFDEALGTDPLPYALWVKNADPFADPHPFFFNYQHPDGPLGEVLGYRDGYADPDRIAELIDEAVRIVDPGERAAIYAELQRLCYEEPLWVYAAQEGLAVAYRDWVEGFQVNPLWRGLQYRYFSKP